jgi:hypothetical protein
MNAVTYKGIALTITLNALQMHAASNATCQAPEALAICPNPHAMAMCLPHQAPSLSNISLPTCIVAQPLYHYHSHAFPLPTSFLPIIIALNEQELTTTRTQENNEKRSRFSQTRDTRKQLKDHQKFMNRLHKNKEVRRHNHGRN